MRRDNLAPLAQTLAFVPMIAAAGLVAWRAQSGAGPGWLIAAAVLLLLAYGMTELPYHLPGEKGKKRPPLVREHKQGPRCSRKPHHKNHGKYNTAA